MMSSGQLARYRSQSQADNRHAGMQACRLAGMHACRQAAVATLAQQAQSFTCSSQFLSLWSFCRPPPSILLQPGSHNSREAKHSRPWAKNGGHRQP